MSEYTPSFGRVRDVYSWAYAWRTRENEGETDLTGLRESNRAEFDRAMQAHDREVAAKALRDFADTIEPITTCPTDVRMARARAAALVSEPSAPEVTVAFRKMDALAATGEDTPEYRAAFAEFERAVRNTTPTTPEPEGEN
jgi:hypothetical protein